MTHTIPAKLAASPKPKKIQVETDGHPITATENARLSLWVQLDG